VLAGGVVARVGHAVRVSGQSFSDEFDFDIALGPNPDLVEIEFDDQAMA
jgi:hypothetical protein